jgi:hypothetical protein
MLTYDPFPVFETSVTPSGLYARKKWLGQEKTPAWRTDFRSAVTNLLQGQRADGSWNQSVIDTIRHLFGLHLTVRESTEGTHRALDWLMDQTWEIVKKRARFGASPRATDLRGLPFSPGRFDRLIAGAALFLATIFGREHRPEVLRQYEKLSRDGIERKGRWCGWSCSNNILRAFVVHPIYCQDEATLMAVKTLSRVQRPSGEWSGGVPFFQTVNALAHLNTREADAQVEAAFQRLRKKQNMDGTWGKSEPEWNTFLVVHAFKNRGIL